MSSPAVARYLHRLGLGSDPAPGVETLVALHRAHVTRVPYENLDIMLGRPASVVPADSLERVAATGRAGYCFHQNGALEVVLRDLGYAVERRHGHVWTRPEHREQTDLNHLVLVVTGLPTGTNPGGRWWPDVGLGEGFLDPVPLVAGAVSDGPFSFGVSDVTEAGWSFANDPHGAFAGLEVRPLPVDHEVVVAAHAVLSTPPTGVFAKFLVVQRRSVGGLTTLRGCVVTEVDATGSRSADLTTYDDWRSALETLGVTTADVDPAELRALHERMRAAHQVWDEAGRP
ncbi:arylamine N-acetyltransferase [soil metagenome]